MKLLLIRSQGADRILSVQGRTLGAFAFALALALGAGGYFTFTKLQPTALDLALVGDWQDKLREQDRLLQALKARSRAESAALGRQLAQVQARLMRMEALGQRVVDVAQLGEGEFSFDQPAALGGPSLERGESLSLMELEKSFADLSARLKVRESELDILDGLLANEEHQDAVSLEGRPVRWGWLSSPYGYRVDPITGQRAWHAGVDFAGKENSDVIAVASGLVTFAGDRHGYGKTVEISHGRGLLTRYAHHAALHVRAGQIVKRGEVIGSMGSTGRSTGPHVHFEVEHRGRLVNPAKYL